MFRRILDFTDVLLHFPGFVRASGGSKWPVVQRILRLTTIVTQYLSIVYLSIVSNIIPLDRVPLDRTSHYTP
jgi:hypothetical protein